VLGVVEGSEVVGLFDGVEPVGAEEGFREGVEIDGLWVGV
jgi:hypothetical protein